VKQGKPTSTWDSGIDADAYTQYAWEYGTPTSVSNERIFTFPGRVGTGHYGGGQSQVRVTINGKGRIHGTPWGPET
jgi:hypothetical protein